MRKPPRTRSWQCRSSDSSRLWTAMASSQFLRIFVRLFAWLSGNFNSLNVNWCCFMWWIQQIASHRFAVQPNRIVSHTHIVNTGWDDQIAMSLCLKSLIFDWSLTVSANLFQFLQEMSSVSKLLERNRVELGRFGSELASQYFQRIFSKGLVDSMRVFKIDQQLLITSAELSGSDSICLCTSLQWPKSGQKVEVSAC